MLGSDRTMLRVLLFVGWALGVGFAQAQDYPTKPIRVVIPNAAGTVADLMIRIMAPDMQQRLGQPIVVENKPGAGQVIGYEYVAKQVPPDGYTLVTVSVTSLVLLPLLTKDLRFDPSKDLPPIIGFMQGRLFLAVPSKTPFKTFAEVVAYAKANPGKLNFGSNSPSTRVPTEMVLQQLGLDVVHVPYPSSASYNKAMITGEVQLGTLGPGDVATLGDGVRVLAITGEKRSPAYPDVPTFAELGFPQVLGAMFSLNGPAGLPPAVVNKVYEAAAYALRQPSVQEQFTKLYAEIEIEPPAVAAKRLASVEKTYVEAVKKIGLQPQ